MTRSETLAETAHILRGLDQPKPASRRMVAAVVAVATALGFLTASALPVRAGTDDLAKALAAIAVIGLIASAADADQDDRPDNKPNRPDPTIPASCGLRLPGDGATVYSERCIVQSGFRYRLPVYCARPAKIYGRADHVYSPNCLSRAGIRIAYRR